MRQADRHAQEASVLEGHDQARDTCHQARLKRIREARLHPIVQRCPLRISDPARVSSLPRWRRAGAETSARVPAPNADSLSTAKELEPPRRRRTFEDGLHLAVSARPPDRSELRGNSDHFSARLEPERNSKWPNKRSKTSKKVIASEQYGVGVSPSQLETIDAASAAAKQPKYCHVV